MTSSSASKTTPSPSTSSHASSPSTTPTPKPQKATTSPAKAGTRRQGRPTAKHQPSSPDNHELLFWAGLAEFTNGDREAGLAQLRQAIVLQPRWLELLGRLQPDIAPGAAEAWAAVSDS